MFLLRHPTESEIDSYLDSATATKFSYSNVGLSLSGNPEGFAVDHNRICIGKGDDEFALSKQAIRDWRMFDFPWVTLYRPNTPIESGQTVGILVNHFGFRSLNASRIVYVIDEPLRFGFAYGTLADHVESGEERFIVELDQETGSIWYDLFAFSRPAHFLAKLGSPIARHLQKRFSADSLAAMKRAMPRGNIS